MAHPTNTMLRLIALHASDVMEKLATNSTNSIRTQEDWIKKTGVRSSSYKFGVDVIVAFELARTHI